MSNKYNFVMCRERDGELVLAERLTLKSDEFTIQPVRHKEVIHLLKYNVRYVLNSKTADREGVYCVVCDSIRADRLIKKCEKILGVKRKHYARATCDMGDGNILYLYDLMEENKTQVLAGINECEPRAYIIYTNNKGNFFNYMNKRVYLHNFVAI